VAAISYAVYVTHMLLAATWLGNGDRMTKYLKRPLLFAATWALSHVSTFYFERPWQAAGKLLSRRIEKR
jgi:peptidoglycan/LPS O-acetylase OafA/YrhL